MPSHDDDKMLDPTLAEILGASSLRESFRNDGLLANRAEAIQVTLPETPAPYSGNLAGQFERGALLQEMLGEFSPDELIKALPLPLRKKESVRVLKGHRLWPSMVRAASRLLKVQPENRAAQFVACVASDHHELARRVAKRALIGE